MWRAGWSLTSSNVNWAFVCESMAIDTLTDMSITTTERSLNILFEANSRYYTHCRRRVQCPHTLPDTSWACVPRRQSNKRTELATSLWLWLTCPDQSGSWAHVWHAIYLKSFWCTGLWLSLICLDQCGSWTHNWHAICLKSFSCIGLRSQKKT